jgi:hypothetical protein
MSAPSFTYSGNVYTAGTAGTVDFALTSTTGNSIPYLEPGHIHVYKSSNQGTSWTELTRPSQWDFVTNGTVARLATGISAGEWVKVQRITPSSAAYVTFQPSSLLTADQLNDDTLFNTYLNQELYDQGNQSSATATAAATAAATATSTANTALSTANAASTTAASAVATANTAASNAATSLSQSGTALTQSSTALTNSAAAVTTANAASADAAASLTQSAAAVTTANNSQTTANTASTNATNAVNTANTAASNASTALSQSNTALSQSATALSQSSTALSQSATALTNSTTAVNTANTANTNATAALNAVAAAVQYIPVANVAAIPSSPANGYAIEVVDSTGIESFSPVANRPAGFVGDLGLSVRMQYSTSGSTWNWLGYFANNPENRYLKLAGGTLTGQLKADDSTSTAAPVYAFDGDTDTGIAHTGANELALVTGGTARLTIDGSGNVNVGGALTKGSNNVVTVGDTGTVTDAMLAGSISPSKITGTAVVTSDSRLTDTRTPTDGSVTDAKVSASAAIAGSKIQAATTTNAGAVQLTDSTSSTSTTTAATPASVKSAYDLANTANTTATTANTTANAALPKAGGAMTGDLTLNAQSDLRFGDADSSNWVAFQGPATVSSNVTWTLPSADGTANQVLSTNGSGTLSWATAAASGATVTTNDTPPSTPVDGDLWYDSVGGRLYVYYQDPNGSQWVDAAPQGGAGTPTKIEVGNTKAEVTDTGSNGTFAVTTEGTERFRVTSSGQIAASSDGSASAPVFTRSTDLDTGLYFIDSNQLALTTGGVQRFTVTNVGAVLHSFGVTNNEAYTFNNTTSGTTYRVEFRTTNTTRGNISVTDSAVAYNTSSDYRLKENIVPLTGAVDRVSQLQVHRFNFIAEPDKTVDGFLAHEAQAVVPECVTGTKDEVDADGNPIYQGIDQSKLVPLITAALQEALQKIETLEAANTDLAARITALEAN